jgi:hypothetical protein
MGGCKLVAYDTNSHMDFSPYIYHYILYHQTRLGSHTYHHLFICITPGNPRSCSVYSRLIHLVFPAATTAGFHCGLNLLHYYGETTLASTVGA